jgi:hypothetical protein
MKTPHVHAKFIKAWADGAEIQYKSHVDGVWRSFGNTHWGLGYEYRIKPEPKPDYVYFATFDTVEGQKVLDSNITSWKSAMDSLRLTFDGETGKLKSAEVL